MADADNKWFVIETSTQFCKVEAERLVHIVGVDVVSVGEEVEFVWRSKKVYQGVVRHICHDPDECEEKIKELLRQARRRHQPPSFHADKPRKASLKFRESLKAHAPKIELSKKKKAEEISTLKRQRTANSEILHAMDQTNDDDPSGSETEKLSDSESMEEFSDEDLVQDNAKRSKTTAGMDTDTGLLRTQNRVLQRDQESSIRLREEERRERQRAEETREQQRLEWRERQKEMRRARERDEEMRQMEREETRRAAQREEEKKRRSAQEAEKRRTEQIEEERRGTIREDSRASDEGENRQNDETARGGEDRDRRARDHRAWKVSTTRATPMHFVHGVDNRFLGPMFVCTADTPDAVEVFPHTNIYCNETEFERAERASTATMYARRLMVGVFTNEALKRCSVTGLPPRGKGKQTYVDNAQAIKPYLDPKGVRAIVCRAKEVQKLRKFFPKKDENQIRQAMAVKLGEMANNR